MKNDIPPDRPEMPTSYGVGDAAYGFEPLSFSWVAERMIEARGYWVVSVHSDGSPHAAPVWGVWLDSRFYFFTDSNSTKARNLSRDARAVVHLESADEVVVLEGRLTTTPATSEVLAAYEDKYSISLGDAPGDMYQLHMSKAIAWLESDFPKTATRWRM